MADNKSNKGQKRKHSKAYYVGAKKQKPGMGTLKVGMSGVLISCNERENACVREAYSVLNEYADKLYGPEITFLGENKEGEEEEEDIEQALAKEKQELKERRRFQSVLSGARNVIFISADLPDNAQPLHLVHSILSDILKNRYNKTRLCLRFLPIATCCQATMQDLKDTATSLFEKYFFCDFIKPCKFSVAYKARNNNSLHRDEVINLLAGLVLDANKGHTVSIGNPDWTICVEVIKGVCGLAVVNDYILLKKYNIHEVQNGPIEGAGDSKSDSKTLEADVQDKDPEPDNKSTEKQEDTKKDSMQSNALVDGENKGKEEISVSVKETDDKALLQLTEENDKDLQGPDQKESDPVCSESDHTNIKQVEKQDDANCNLNEQPLVSN